MYHCCKILGDLGNGVKVHRSIYKNDLKKSYLQHVSVLNFNSLEYFIWWFVWMYTLEAKEFCRKI